MVYTRVYMYGLYGRYIPTIFVVRLYRHWKKYFTCWALSVIKWLYLHAWAGVCVLYSRLSRKIGITQDPSTVTDFDLYSPKQSYVICYVLWDSMHKIVSVLLCTIKYNHNTFHHLLPIYFNVNFNLIVSFLWLIYQFIK